MKESYMRSHNQTKNIDPPSKVDPYSLDVTSIDCRSHTDAGLSLTIIRIDAERRPTDTTPAGISRQDLNSSDLDKSIAAGKFNGIAEKLLHCCLQDALRIVAVAQSLGANIENINQNLDSEGSFSWRLSNWDNPFLGGTYGYWQWIANAFSALVSISDWRTGVDIAAKVVLNAADCAREPIFIQIALCSFLSECRASIAARLGTYVTFTTRSAATTKARYTVV